MMNEKKMKGLDLSFHKPVDGALIIIIIIIPWAATSDGRMKIASSPGALASPMDPSLVAANRSPPTPVVVEPPDGLASGGKNATKGKTPSKESAVDLPGLPAICCWKLLFLLLHDENVDFFESSCK